MNLQDLLNRDVLVGRITTDCLDHGIRLKKTGSCESGYEP
jgi:hypothetical protein